MLPDPSALAWVALALGAFLIGFSKTALPGINMLSVLIFASVLPTKLSTAAVLLLFLVGDVFALLAHRRHAHWPTLFRMLPAVLVGTLVGAVFLHLATDEVLKKSIGLLLLAMLGLALWQRRPGLRTVEATSDSPAPVGSSRLLPALLGGLSGLSSIVANAGGPVVSLYFLLARFPVRTFLGTAAWFFAVINVCKLPLLVGLGLVTPSLVSLTALLVPALLLGAVCGLVLVKRIPQALFDVLVLFLTGAGSLWLLVS